MNRVEFHKKVFDLRKEMKMQRERYLRSRQKRSTRRTEEIKKRWAKEDIEREEKWSRKLERMVA